MRERLTCISEYLFIYKPSESSIKVKIPRVFLACEILECTFPSNNKDT